MTDEILQRWAAIISTLDLIPGSKGRFEVSLDDELVFSKVKLGRHARDGEVVKLLESKMGPPITAE